MRIKWVAIYNAFETANGIKPKVLTSKIGRILFFAWKDFQSRRRSYSESVYGWVIINKYCKLPLPVLYPSPTCCVCRLQLITALLLILRIAHGPQELFIGKCLEAYTPFLGTPCSWLIRGWKWPAPLRQGGTWSLVSCMLQSCLWDQTASKLQPTHVSAWLSPTLFNFSHSLSPKSIPQLITGIQIPISCFKLGMKCYFLTLQHESVKEVHNDLANPIWTMAI